MEVKNPIRFKSDKIKHLDEAKILFVKVLDEYLQRNPDKVIEINELKKDVELAYISRKSHYFLENRLDFLNDYLTNAFSFALEDKNSLEDISSSLLYLKHSKRFTLNEQ